MKVVRLSALRTGCLYPGKYSWYSFLSKSESTPEPLCAGKDYVNEKFQCHNRETNPRPSGLQHSASTNCATAREINRVLFRAQQPPQGARASSFTRFLDHTYRRTTVGRTPLDGWSARRRDLYQTTRNTHNRHPVGFEPTISTGEQLQTYASDRTTSGFGNR